MTQSVSFRFHCEDLPDDTFSVASFSGEEGISRLYRFGIDLVSENADLDVDDIQNRSGRLVIKAGGRERVIQGIVIRTDIVDHAEGHVVYRVELAPRVWSLTRSSGNAVYLHRSTPEILRGVLEDRLGITGIDRDERFAIDEYPERPFQLQYGETDWAFLSALMEHDGIYYFFRPGNDTEHIVFCDYTGGQPEPEETAVEYNAELGLHTTEVDGTVHNLLARHEHLPEAVEVRNYDDERPSIPIHARAEVDPRGSGTVHFYGQNTRDPEEAQAIADIRAEELACMKAVYHGESTASHLAAGHRFRLTGHPRERCNGTFQVLSVEHSGHDPEVCGRIGRDSEGTTPVYDNRFTALPGDVQFRPPRRTERPRIQGTLNAHIDAEGDGVFAEPDGEGRYHVVFPFHPGFHDTDTRDDAGKASHWLRLIQPYGGKAEGMHFPLRKGTRVLVGFVGGNPDLPVINGTIPNAEQPSVLQDRNLNKGTIRTPGGNLIETDDEKPRVKLYSPMKNTYMHLGSSNAPGDGIVTATNGLAIFTALGGSGVHHATDGWVVNSSVWPLQTRDHRDSQLGTYTLLGLVDHETETEWRVDDAVEKIFAFPRKHQVPSSQDDDYDPQIHSRLSDKDHLTRDDELSNVFHTTRRLGDAYTYRSGTDFTFLGPQRETFTFGGMASYTSWSHQEDQEELRKTVTTVMDAFGGDQGDYTPNDNIDTERNEYEDEKDTRIRKEALLVGLMAQSERSYIETNGLSFPTSVDIRETAYRDVIRASTNTVKEVVTTDGKSVLTQNGAKVMTSNGGQILTEYGATIIPYGGNKVVTDGGENVIARDSTAKKDEATDEDVTIDSHNNLVTASFGVVTTDDNDAINVSKEPIDAQESFRAAVDRIADALEINKTILTPNSNGQIEIDGTNYSLDGEVDSGDDPTTGSGYKGDIYVSIRDDLSNNNGDYDKSQADELMNDKWSDADYRILYRAEIAHALQRAMQDAEEDPQKDESDTFTNWFEGNSLDLDDEKDDILNQSGFKDYMKVTIERYGKKRLAYSAAWRAFIDAWKNSQSSRIRNGNMSITNVDSLSISRGTSYSYTLGASYSETHVADIGNIISGSNSSDTLDSTFSGTVNQSHDEDLTENDGPRFSKVNVNKIGGNWDAGEVNVSKTIGNSYSYQYGDSTSVQVGNSHSVTRKSHSWDVVKSNSHDGQTIMESEWEPTHQNTKIYNAHTGNLFSVDDIHWDAPNGRRTHSVTMGGIGAISVNLQAKGSIELNVGISATTTINVGAVTDCSINILNRNTIEATAALQLNAKFSPGGIYEILNSKTEWNGPGIALGQELAKIDSRVTEVGKAAACLNKRTAVLKNSTVAVDTCTAAHLKTAGIHVYN